MPIPDKPYTRREAYLNAAARGDYSGIPETPYTREEMYLDAIAKGGGGGGGGGSSTLSGLTDVDISNPTDGQVLVYNAATGKWENGAGGGGVLVVPFEFVDEKPTLMVKAGDIYDAMARGIHVVVVFSVPDVGVVQAQPLYCVSIEPQSMDKLFVLSEPGATILMTANIPVGVYTAETDDDYPTLNGGA